MSEGFQLKHHLLNMQLQVDQNSLQIQVDIQQMFLLGGRGGGLPRKKSRRILMCVALCLFSKVGLVSWSFKEKFGGENQS